MSGHPRILLIDSYDSFTHNLAALCRRAIPDCNVHIIRNDDLVVSELIPLLPYFSAVIIGPGPGSPEHPSDIGVVKDIWTVSDRYLLPVFGVCLGLQSLAVEFGASLNRLDVVKHGQISRIIHEGVEIFKGIGDIAAVRYHSLHVKLCGDEEVEPLAWADDADDNGRVVMALKHKTRPFWAVQYHPESVCTREGGEEVLHNFWRLAKNWSTIKRRVVVPWTAVAERIVGPPWPQPVITPQKSLPTRDSTVTTRRVELRDLTLTGICQSLGVEDDSTDFVFLESAAQPGRFSIIGCLTSESTRITYFLGESFIRVREKGKCYRHDLGTRDVWSWLAAFMQTRRARGGQEVPFWGGLVGYLSYELGISEQRSGHHPDVNLVFVERSVVVDSTSGQVYIQSLFPEDIDWLDGMASKLEQMGRSPSDATSTRRKRRKSTAASPLVTLPDREHYIASIERAKEFLFSGDSYELCLTAPTHISIPKSVSTSQGGGSSSWDLYKSLRARNPAPHSAYLRLHPSTLLSSSPERFLSFSRPPHTTCQLRPIKGTVRKAPGITRAVAEKALVGSTKEVAENLMIVDLIRHDLHGVVGEDVEVKQFCKVEEYETVWQLVSVIEGKLSPEVEALSGANIGWEVLRKSLPPGSMTGAPKKRSVEILQSLEGQERGIYSGVFGYWCVGGGGDWSVTIRSCFKHDDASGHPTTRTEPQETHSDSTHNNLETDEWTLGAGGAITALSDPEAEWEEMVVKVESVLRAFGEVRYSSTDKSASG
ncbi:para-aminobenzoic acid synthetase [Amylocystis lapponica]|nr:para-aminobenzoic acid synthetase [Amylocystis lapponica]